MSISKIESALTSHFISAGHFPSDMIAFENASFSTPQDGPWCRLFFIPNDPTVATLGDDGSDITDGVFQIDLMFPQGTGNGAAREKFEEIKQTFKAGDELIYQTQTVRIRSCGRNNGRADGSFFKITVSVYWYAFLSR